MKKLFVVLVAALVLFAVPAFASNDVEVTGSGQGNTGANAAQNRGSGIANTGNNNVFGSSTTINGGIKNTANGGNATIGNVSGGSSTVNNNIGNGINNFSPSAKAEATIEKGAVQNYNANVGINKNTNVNTNRQGQLQGQVQGQAQNNNQVISPEQNVTIINPDNKRDLPNIPTYQAPGQLEFRGPYKDGIQAVNMPWLLQESWGKSEIESFYSMNDSATCKVYRMNKIREATDALKVSKGEGPVSCVLECTADSGNELWGTAGMKAMECGAKSIYVMAYKVTFANKSFGWNVGFGGGVTAVGNGNNDYMGGSVGGGTGIGSVTTMPIEKVSGLFIAR